MLESLRREETNAVIVAVSRPAPDRLIILPEIPVVGSSSAAADDDATVGIERDAEAELLKNFDTAEELFVLVLFRIVLKLVFVG